MTDFFDKLIPLILEEDLGSQSSQGDITSQTVIDQNQMLQADLISRQEMVVAGLPLVEKFLNHLAPDSIVAHQMNEGDKIKPNTIITRITGKARDILAAERTILNFMQHISGVATLTREYVDQIKDTGAILLDTRKTTPTLRALEKYAVHVGGGQNHRMGLYDAFMVKDNHLALGTSITDIVAKIKSLNTGKHITVECDTLAQLDEAVSAGANRALLDNMPPGYISQAVEKYKGQIELEASGGVTLQTIRNIAETGVDYISVGRITQSAPAVDISMETRPLIEKEKLVATG